MSKRRQQGTMPAALQAALEHHRAGRLAQAEAMYLKLPTNPDALNLAGVVAYETGRPLEAIELIRKAVRLNPGDATYQYHLGLCYAALGRGDEARAAYQAAIARNPRYVDAYNNLGVLWREHGQPEAAIECCRKAVAIDPGYVAAYSNLGAALKDAGRFEESLSCCLQALERDPGHAGALGNLAATLSELKRYDEAVACARRALALDPHNVDALGNLGGALREQGHLDEAESAYRQAIALRPQDAVLHFNLGSLLVTLRRAQEAIDSLSHALLLAPALADASNSLGAVLLAQGRMAEATVHFGHALHNAAARPTALNNMGTALLYQCHLEQAIAHFEQALVEGADPGITYSNLLFSLNYHPTLSAEAIFAVYRRWNAEQALPMAHALAPPPNPPQPNARLKVGYVSGDFRNHSVIHFAGPLLQHHDHGQVEVFCYHNSFAEDDQTRRIMGYADHWIACRAMSDAELARRIRADGIDVLVDLSGHTLDNRLLAFASRPAPVQVSWMGFGYTTGLDAMDYFIGDEHFTPPGCEHLFSETVHRLPRAPWAYQPQAEAPPPGPLPARARGYVTFACVSTTTRINAPVLAAWADILRRLPTARLRLDTPVFRDAGVRDDIAARLLALGVAASQLEIGYTSPVWTVYQEVDIVLDCFPHNSGTTTTEALWMGLPVVSMAGRPSVGRFGASILAAIGRQHWIATDAEGYIGRAVALAQDIDGLERERATLREAMRQSSLLDHRGFAAAMEEAYRSMWQDWCATRTAAPGEQQLRAALEHHQAGRLQEADAMYALLPDHSDALHLRGVIASQTGRPQLAAELIGRAIALNASQPRYYCNLGSAQQALGEYEAAVASYRQALAIDPGYAMAHSNMGSAMQDLGQPQEAMACFRAAIAAQPDYADAHSNLGSVLKGLGRLEEAVASYRQAIALAPALAVAHFNLGNALRDLGQLDAAQASFEQVIALRPGYADAWSNLGTVFKMQGRLEEAVASYEQALALAPELAASHFNLGNARHAQLKFNAAIDSYLAALELQPEMEMAHNNLGLVLKDIGKLDDALTCFRNALTLVPDDVNANSNLLYCVNYHPTMPAQDIFAAYQAWDARQAARLAGAMLPAANVRDPLRRLRVGYLSADLRHHSVIFFAGPLIEQHDKAAVEVFCYYNQSVQDAYTERMIAAADHWLACQDMSDEALAARIRADGIDVLVDLSGHTLGNRLLVYARKPAPVQVSWLGFGYTTGLRAMDYFIGDAHFTPPGSDELFSETVYRLPRACWSYEPPAAPDPGPLPARARGHVTFACVSTTVRLQECVIEAWAAILRRLPQARLRLDTRNFSDPDLCREMEAHFARHGVAADRLQIGFTSPVWQVYQEVDIVLDCFPHNCGTTTLEALWMGLPVVSVKDRPSMGRIGDSVLCALGKEGWVADDIPGYVELAVALAQDIDALEHERRTLRRQMQASPLQDHAGFARAMEAAYRAMWQHWCQQGSST